MTAKKKFQGAKKEKVLEITPEYLFVKLSLVPAGRVLFLRLGVPFFEKSEMLIISVKDKPTKPNKDKKKKNF